MACIGESAREGWRQRSNRMAKQIYGRQDGHTFTGYPFNSLPSVYTPEARLPPPLAINSENHMTPPLILVVARRQIPAHGLDEDRPSSWWWPPRRRRQYNCVYKTAPKTRETKILYIYVSHHRDQFTRRLKVKGTPFGVSVIGPCLAPITRSRLCSHVSCLNFGSSVTLIS